jgi:hypothetical protein
MSEVVREALEAFLDGAPLDRDAALDSTFGALPHLVVPSRMAW